jgi:hypothetical protein
VRAQQDAPDAVHSEASLRARGMTSAPTCVCSQLRTTDKEPDGRATETSALPQLYTVLELAVVFSLVVVAE